jgi:hypothetical protein
MELLRQAEGLSEALRGTAWIPAIRGAAQAGDAALVAELFPQWDEKEMRRAAVAGAALGGHVDLLDLYLNDGDVQQALSYAACGGHRAVVNKILLRFPEDQRIAWRMHCVPGAADGGHVALLDEYLGSSEDSLFSLTGAVGGGQFDLMNQLLKRKGANTHALVSAAERCGYFKTEERAAAFLAKIHDPNIRKELARQSILQHEAMKRTIALNPDFVAPTRPLLPLLQRANEPMKQHGLSYATALAWEQNQYVLQTLLSGKECDFTVLPEGVRERIAQHICRLVSIEISKHSVYG